MRITCLGAARTVTGSCFKIELPDNGFILVDCGMFQGGRQMELRNFDTALYSPDFVRAIVLTHAHMDHSGLAPRLVKAGYRGPIHVTEATGRLLEVMWRDAAYIQEHEADWKNRKNRRSGGKTVAPLYVDEDVTEALNLIKPLPFDREVEILPGVTVRYFIAGHILGAASILMVLTHKGTTRRVVFSGDIGRTGQLIVPDPTIPPRSDHIFMETTYGNRDHKDLETSIDELLQVIRTAYREGGRVIIPVFAVERTQEVIFVLAKAWQQELIPRDMPIFLDSPMAIKATEIYAEFARFYGPEIRAGLRRGVAPVEMPTLLLTRSTEESKRINESQGPAIVMAGSGMANAGRVLHHLKHHLWRENSHIVFVGFQAEGTTGRRLVEGAQEVTIFREPIAVKAAIHTIGGFSGHADQTELLNWLEPQIHPGIKVNFIHGEESGTLAFYERARQKWPEAEFKAPRWREVIELADEPLADWAAPVRESALSATGPEETKKLARRLEQLGLTFSRRAGRLAPDELARLNDLLNQAEGLLSAAKPAD